MSKLSGFHLPAGVTLGGIAVVVLGLAALLVIARLARVLGKLAAAAAAPVTAPAGSGGKGKILLFAAAAAAGLWFWGKHGIGAATAKAAPVPSPSASPSPHPTVTQTVAPHVTQAAHHLLAVSGNVVALYAIGGAVAIVVVGSVIRRLA
jgi:hypothetical protein